MNVAGTQNKADTVNVLPLFGNIEVPMLDPMEELLREAYLEDDVLEEELIPERKVEMVKETQFPDQSMYVLEKQLAFLKESLNRIRFYLGDIDDLIPTKK